MYRGIPTQRSCARAWVAATSAIIETGDKGYNVVIDVEDPWNHDDRDNAIITLVDKFLNAHDENPVITVANTIFPQSLYVKYGAPGLYAAYHRWASLTFCLLPFAFYLLAFTVCVGPSAILTGSRTLPSDWGSNARFGPVENRRNNRRLATFTCTLCVLQILQIWWLSPFTSHVWDVCLVKDSGSRIEFQEIALTPW